MCSEVFLVFNVALVSYTELNLKNAYNMTSTQEFASIQLFNLHKVDSENTYLRGVGT